MTSKPPPSGKGGKPFLGEDDLLSELDAWDATFDALHGGPETSANDLAAQPMEWPEPIPEPMPDPSPSVSQFAPLATQLDPLAQAGQWAVFRKRR